MTTCQVATAPGQTGRSCTNSRFADCNLAQPVFYTHSVHEVGHARITGAILVAPSEIEPGGKLECYALSLCGRAPADLAFATRPERSEFIGSWVYRFKYRSWPSSRLGVIALRASSPRKTSSRA